MIYALTGGWPRIIFRPSDTFRKDPFVWRRFLSQPDPPRKCLSGDSLSPKLHLSKTRTICFPGFVKQPSCHSTNLRLQFLSPFCNEKTCFSILYDFFLDVLKFVTILLPAIFQNSIFFYNNGIFMIIWHVHRNDIGFISSWHVILSLPFVDAAYGNFCIFLFLASLRSYPSSKFWYWVAVDNYSKSSHEYPKINFIVILIDNQMILYVTCCILYTVYRMKQLFR